MAHDREAFVLRHTIDFRRIAHVQVVQVRVNGEDLVFMRVLRDVLSVVVDGTLHGAPFQETAIAAIVDVLVGAEGICAGGPDGEELRVPLDLPANI